MNREEVITELARIIREAYDNNWYHAGKPTLDKSVAKIALDWLDSIGYDPCFELGINIHGHSLAEMMGE